MSAIYHFRNWRCTLYNVHVHVHTWNCRVLLSVSVSAQIHRAGPFNDGDGDDDGDEGSKRAREQPNNWIKKTNGSKRALQRKMAKLHKKNIAIG